MNSLEKLRFLTSKLNHYVRCSSTVASRSLLFTQKFTKAEQLKVLEILNKSTPIELSRLKLPHQQIKYLQNRKEACGPLEDLTQVLEVDGIEVGNFEKLCQRILASNLVEQTTKANVMSRKQFVWPTFKSATAEDLETALGIHIETAGMSWTKFHKNSNSVIDWDFYSFNNLPAKILPNDNFNLALMILNTLPPANVYVFEMQSPKGGKSPSFMQIFEFNSMLYALINTNLHRNEHQVDITNNVYTNKIYHLRNSLSARLFKTLIGGEKVSTIGTVRKLFNKDNLLPCKEISVNDSLVEQYETVPNDSKELLGHSLLLTITFMEIVVYKNHTSIKALQPGHK